MRERLGVLLVVLAGCVQRSSVGVLGYVDAGVDRGDSVDRAEVTVDVFDIGTGVIDVSADSVDVGADGSGDSGETGDVPAEQRCELGLELCDGSCVDTRRDRENCGGCGNVCAERGYVPGRYDCFNGMCGEAVVDLSLGVAHGCAVLRQGTVHCWGANTYGQLGDGSTRSVLAGTVRVTGISDAVAVSCGARHTCVVHAAGAMSCWGDNSDGQLGDGSLWMRGDPVAVSGIRGATEVSVGNRHSCALAEGEVWCWGNNERGVLGTGDIDSSVRPVEIAGLGVVDALGSGVGFACARVGESVWCWGDNGGGVRGTPPTEPASLRATALPLRVGAETVAVRELAVGAVHGCVRDTGGRGYCWGSNTEGQVGVGMRSDWEPLRELVLPDGRRNFKLIVTAPGASHTCALDENWALYCWGRNNSGELGEGTRQTRWSPTLVSLSPPLPVFGLLRLGPEVSCAVTADRMQVWCWGDGRVFGRPSELAVLRPVRVGFLPPGP